MSTVSAAPEQRTRWWHRRRWWPPGWAPLAALVAGAGVAHWVLPGAFESLVPHQLGDPTPWVLGSGALEIACAAGLAAPRTRAAAALASAALFVAVFPGNVQMAVTALRSEHASAWYQAGTLARLPLQVPLVAWAWSIRRRAARGPRQESVRPGFHNAGSSID